MKAETPALGISKLRSYDSNAMVYKIDCECCDPNHYHIVEVEADKEVNEVIVHIYTETTTDYWTEYVEQSSKTDNDYLYHLRWNIAYAINESVRRIKIATRAIFRGCIQREATLILNKQQALNYARAVEKSVQDLEESKQRDQ